MPTSFSVVGDNAQNGYADGSGLFVGGGTNSNISVGVNQYMYFRFPTYVPVNSTISSAVLKLPFGTKDGNSTQTSGHTVYVHQSVNSPELVQGQSVFDGSRSSSATSRTITITYDQPTNTNSTHSFDVTALVNSITGLVPGGYITFTVLCNSETGDMNFSVGNGPSLEIAYTTSGINLWDFNLMVNGQFNNDTFGWYENAFLGSYTTGGTFTRDTSFTFNGRPTLRYTTPAPVTDKACGPTTGAAVTANEPVIFTGWIYVPSSITATVTPQFFFDGFGDPNTIPRGVWHPFCTDPLTYNANAGRFPTITIYPGFTAGQNIWLADVSIFKSAFRQPTFSLNSDTKGGRFTYVARQSTSRGTIARQRNPRSFSMVGTTMARRHAYTLNSDGMWVPNSPSLI